jgi:hypothetical protein
MTSDPILCAHCHLGRVEQVGDWCAYCVMRKKKAREKLERFLVKRRQQEQQQQEGRWVP